MSHYSPYSTPDDDTLRQLAKQLQAAGGSIARIVTAANDVTDSLRMLALMQVNAGQYSNSRMAPTTLLQALLMCDHC